MDSDQVVLRKPPDQDLHCFQNRYTRIKVEHFLQMLAHLLQIKLVYMCKNIVFSNSTTINEIRTLDTTFVCNKMIRYRYGSSLSSQDLHCMKIQCCMYNFDMC